VLYDWYAYIDSRSTKLGHCRRFTSLLLLRLLLLLVSYDSLAKYHRIGIRLPGRLVQFFPYSCGLVTFAWINFSRVYTSIANVIHTVRTIRVWSSNNSADLKQKQNLAVFLIISALVMFQIVNMKCTESTFFAVHTLSTNDISDPKCASYTLHNKQ